MNLLDLLTLYDFIKPQLARESHYLGQTVGQESEVPMKQNIFSHPATYTIVYGCERFYMIVPNCTSLHQFRSLQCQNPTKTQKSEHRH